MIRGRQTFPRRSCGSPALVLLTVIVLMSAGLAGCARRESDALYEISGGVTFAGRPWQTTLDLPREACRRDFDVPADAAGPPAQSR